MADMLAVALATDRTRNATFMFTLPAAHVYYRSLGDDMNDDFHDTICHTDPGEAAEQTRVHRGVVYTMESLAVFLERLAGNHRRSRDAPRSLAGLRDLVHRMGQAPRHRRLARTAHR